MLSASYLASVSDGLVELYSNLESDIIADMARRLSKLGNVTEATEHQAAVFRELGGLQEDILIQLGKYNTQAQKQLATLFDEAMQKAAQKDLAALNKAGLSDAQQQILDATVKKTASAGIVGGSEKVKREAEQGFIKVFSGVQRATMTIASSMCNEFVQQANGAYMKVASGAFDYNTALKQGVDSLAQKGIYTVEYTDSGKLRSRSIEGALRANIMTGINQTASQITLDNAQELGCDLVEVSAHMGARPSHEAWQGKIYSLSGTSDKYPSFYEVCKPGTPDGICGINCRHSYYPYFEGMPRLYDNGELDEMKDRTVTYNGKKMTQYEGEQKQRAIEREIRKFKRQAKAEEQAGLDNTAARQKLGEWQAAARDFVDQTGLRRDYAREYIGTSDGKQVRGIRAVNADRKIPVTETKAAASAVKEFPAEEWEERSPGVFVAKSREPKNKEQQKVFDKEYAMAQIAQKHGHTVYMLPETSKGKNPDVIMDGVKTEFKNITGGENAVSHRFRESIRQGKNSFLKIDSSITAVRVKELLYGVVKDKEYTGTIYFYITNENKLYKWTKKGLK